MRHSVTTLSYRARRITDRFLSHVFPSRPLKTTLFELAPATTTGLAHAIPGLAASALPVGAITPSSTALSRDFPGGWVSLYTMVRDSLILAFLSPFSLFSRNSLALLIHFLCSFLSAWSYYPLLQSPFLFFCLLLSSAEPLRAVRRLPFPRTRFVERTSLHNLAGFPRAPAQNSWIQFPYRAGPRSGAGVCLSISHARTRLQDDLLLDFPGKIATFAPPFLLWGRIGVQMSG